MNEVEIPIGNLSFEEIASKIKFFFQKPLN